MPPPSFDNVSPFRRPAKGGGRSTELREIFLGVVKALDELSDGFTRIEPSLHWSPAKWGTVSMPFYMRLDRAERQLERLRQIDPASCRDTAWSIELASARIDFEQELQAVTSLLDMLVDYDLPPGERAWQAQRFTSGGKGFLETLQRLRDVIAARYPRVRRPS
jgi:hypothetical protein